MVGGHTWTRRTDRHVAKRLRAIRLDHRDGRSQRDDRPSELARTAAQRIPGRDTPAGARTHQHIRPLAALAAPRTRSCDDRHADDFSTGSDSACNSIATADIAVNNITIGSARIGGTTTGGTTFCGTSRNRSRNTATTRCSAYGISRHQRLRPLGTHRNAAHIATKPHHAGKRPPCRESPMM